MKIGVRAHDYGKHSIEGLASLLREEGYDGAQLALPKVFEEIDSYEDIRLSHIERIRRAFEKNRVEIPVMGCYMDLGNPDRSVREYAVETLKNCLLYAKEMGAGVVGTETAYPRLSREERAAWCPYMMDSLMRVMEEAQRIDMKLAIEPVYWHPIADLETTLKTIRMVDDPAHLRLIFDASNLLEFPETTDQDAYWNQWLASVGTYIDVMHIKDYSLGKDRAYQPKQLGEGILRYAEISRWLHENKPDMYLLREEMNPASAGADIAFMRRM